MGGLPRYAMVTLVTLAVAALAACSAGDQDPQPTRTAPSQIGTPAAVATVAPGSTGTVELGDRPFRLHVPPGYDPSTPVPLVVGLHGYTSNSTENDSFFGLSATADERGYLLALPEGTVNPAGDQFWNAVEGGCCDFYGSDVDDVAYLSSVIATVRAAYDVDQVVMIGHSNGGYMAHRFACDRADEVDAITALAGTLPYDTSRCQPSEPVRVLHIHGDSDETVAYGGSAGASSASAEDTVATWAELDGCGLSAEQFPAIDLETSIEGAETTRTVFDQGCADGGGVELWTIANGRHVPTLSADTAAMALDFMLGA